MKENLDHEFSVEFRQEIKNLGWRQVISNLLVSKSDKNQKRIGYISRECSKKPALRREITGILCDLKDRSPQKVLSLEQQILM